MSNVEYESVASTDWIFWKVSSAISSVIGFVRWGSYNIIKMSF
jgi:hypothetical protein